MAVSKLQLTSYRNHSDFIINTDDAKFVIISGNNGVGKTNILESLSLYSPGKGFRGVSMDEIVSGHSNDNSWFSSIELKTPDDDHRIASAYMPKNPGERSRRVLKANETILSRQGDIIEYLRVIWLTPQMDGLFSNSPSARRKMVDRITYNMTPEHAEAISKFEFATRSRLKLLIEGGYNQAWMKSIESSLIDNAVAIYNNRKNALEQISKSLKGLETEFLKPDLKIEGAFEIFMEENAGDDIKDKLALKYQMMRGIDAKAKKTIFGPNRADLVAINTLKNISASICSTGEQKSMVVSLILGQVKNLNEVYGIEPLVLLDEIFSHFDEDRIKMMINELKKLKAQFWITTTDGDLHTYFDERCISVSI